MTAGSKKWIRVGGMVLWGAGLWWYTNPIRWHQRVQVAGVTIPVPFGWVARITPSQVEPLEYVNLRRAYIPFRPWVTGTVARGTRRGEPYTMESAREAQAGSAAEYGNSAYYSNPKTFDLSSGKYPSLCAEGTMPGKDKIPGAQVLSCFVVGTPLRANFMSPKDVDGDAKRMLASLN